MIKPETAKPAIHRVIWTDYPSFYSSLILVITWIVMASWIPAWNEKGPIIPTVSVPFWLGAATLISLVCLGVLVRRFWLLWSTFRDGVQVPGKIMACTMRRDRGQVKYTYIYDKSEHTGSASIHRTKQTLALKTGDRVTLVVHRKQPQLAYIRHLYI